MDAHPGKIEDVRTYGAPLVPDHARWRAATRHRWSIGDVLVATPPLPLGDHELVTAPASILHPKLRPAPMRLTELRRPSGTLTVIGLSQNTA